MKVKKQIPKVSFVKDLRMGKSDLALMQKYDIQSTLTFHKIIRGLLNCGDISGSEARERLPEECRALDRNFRDAIEKRAEIEIIIRKETRNTPFGDLYVDDTGDFCNYRILDISESGLKVMPIQVEIGDQRKFKIRPKEFDDIKPIDFIAECRWVEKPTAGFEISSITPGNAAELKKLIKVLTFEEF